MLAEFEVEVALEGEFEGEFEDEDGDRDEASRPWVPPVGSHPRVAVPAAPSAAAGTGGRTV